MLAVQAPTLGFVLENYNQSASIKQVKGSVSKMSNLKQENLISIKLIRDKFPLQ